MWADGGISGKEGVYLLQNEGLWKTLGTFGAASAIIQVSRRKYETSLQQSDPIGGTYTSTFDSMFFSDMIAVDQSNIATSSSAQHSKDQSDESHGG